ncbi:MAG: hypothetical protein ABSH45_21055, partial [Bryobacteraceae bacterium]
MGIADDDGIGGLLDRRYQPCPFNIRMAAGGHGGDFAIALAKHPIDTRIKPNLLTQLLTSEVGTSFT